MNSSYTIALFVAIALCGIILGYHVFSDRGEPHSSDSPVVVQNQPSQSGSTPAPSSGSNRPTMRGDQPFAPPPERPISPPPSDTNRGDATQGQGLNPGGVAMVDGTQNLRGSDSPTLSTPAVPTQSGNAANPTTPVDARSVMGNQAQPTQPARQTPSSVTPANTNPHNLPSTGRGSLVHNTPQSGPTYTIQSGDTFASIALEKLGSESKHQLIAEANPYVDPRRLKVGQVIRLPHPDHPTNNPPSTPGSTTPATSGAGPTEYTVQSGDTLSRISRVHYGDPNLWEVIYLANKARIGSDPGGIKPGMKLFIPPEPRIAQ